MILAIYDKWEADKSLSRIRGGDPFAGSLYLKLIVFIPLRGDDPSKCKVHTHLLQFIPLRGDDPTIPLKI